MASHHCIGNPCRLCAGMDTSDGTNESILIRKNAALKEAACRAMVRLYNNRLTSGIRAYEILGQNLDSSLLKEYGLTKEHPDRNNDSS